MREILNLIYITRYQPYLHGLPERAKEEFDLILDYLTKLDSWFDSHQSVDSNSAAHYELKDILDRIT